MTLEIGILQIQVYQATIGDRKTHSPRNQSFGGFTNGCTDSTPSSISACPTLDHANCGDRARNNGDAFDENLSLIEEDFHYYYNCLMGPNARSVSSNLKTHHK
jgi:hypothetical protein